MNDKNWGTRERATDYLGQSLHEGHLVCLVEEIVIALTWLKFEEWDR